MEHVNEKSPVLSAIQPFDHEWDELTVLFDWTVLEFGSKLDMEWIDMEEKHSII